MVLINSTGLTVASSAIIFLIVTLLLVVLLLVAKHYLVPSGKVKIDINGGKRQLEVETGSSLLGTLHENGVMLSSACVGNACCGESKGQGLEDPGQFVPTEQVACARLTPAHGIAWRILANLAEVQPGHAQV